MDQEKLQAKLVQLNEKISQLEQINNQLTVELLLKTKEVDNYRNLLLFLDSRKS